jgi:hypothetical protein
MSLIYMTHSGVVGTVQTDQQSFLDIWQAKGWTIVSGPATDPGITTVLAQGDPADGQVPVYDSSTGRYGPTDVAAASLPTGGTTGQVLTKTSGGAGWATPTATQGPPGPPGPPGKDGTDGTGGGTQIGRWG